MKSEVDKFRGFLQDVISFEPDYILAPAIPRIHYFSKDGHYLYIHELASQSTQTIPLNRFEQLPSEFVSVQAQNKIFIVGGEKKESDSKCVFANETYEVNEQTYNLIKRASMKTARAGHTLAHLHKKLEFQTKDLIYAIGSKYPDESSAKCEVYDVSKNKWEAIGQLNQGRHFHSCCVMDQRYIYISGGRDSINETPLETIERLDAVQPLEN